MERWARLTLLRLRNCLLFILALLTLNGCVTQGADVMQVVTAGTWGVYLASVTIIHFFARDYKLRD